MVGTGFRAKTIRPIGMGATFQVALARFEPSSSHAEDVFVVKRPIPRLRHLPEGNLALEREWEALQRFPLGSLPKPLFRGQDEVGPYIAESLAPGASLRQWQERGRLPLEIFGRIAIASSRALVDLHEHRDESGPLGFVHGDISPGNVFFDGDARVTFIDLGTSHWRGRAPVFPKARGTLPYAPPELAREEGWPTAETDTYSLAAVLAKLLVPDLGESANEAALLVEVAERGLRIERIGHRKDLPARASKALRGALAFEKEARLASSRELAAELAAAFAG